MKTYKTHPMSLVFNILTKIAVVLTISVFVLIVGYVVIKGCLLYTSDAADE